MSSRRISITVRDDGQISARQWDNDAHSPSDPVRYGGLDRELVQHFERWLTLRDRSWRPDEIRTFGMLLHRCLFTDRVWGWIQQRIDDRGDDLVRLSLTFPGDGPYASLASVPWEYLHTPESDTRSGVFLAHERGIVLSRYVPDDRGVQPPNAPGSVRVLVVVSRPEDRLLGPVLAEPVLSEITATAEQLDLDVRVLEDPTSQQLSDAVEQVQPHLLHYLGHGEFVPDRGYGALALSRPEGGTHWLRDTQVAHMLRRPGTPPRVVLLHSCEGGTTNFEERFAGLAPQLIRNGVQCVVAMQYAVTNRTAIAFSTALYQEVSKGRDIDVAVQECRWRLGNLPEDDPRLLGIPVIYLRSSTPLMIGRRERAAEAVEP